MNRQAIADNTNLKAAFGLLKDASSPITLNATSANKAEITLKRDVGKTLRIRMRLHKVQMQLRLSVHESLSPAIFIFTRGCW